MVDDGVVYRKGPKGQRVPVRRQFADDFEDAKVMRDLVGLERGWTHFTLLSPKASTIPEYNALRKRILEGGDFLDNRIELSGEQARSGRTSLRCYSVPATSEMVTAKALLETTLLHFVKGDDVWFSGWFFVRADSPMPSTLMDLETTWLNVHPGIRIFVFGGQYLGMELKWFPKPKYRQPPGKEVAFPRGRWVHVKVHLKLSDGRDGVVELWQDGAQIGHESGQTLPMADSIYNSLQVGITAHGHDSLPAVLFVDDVQISDQPIE